MRSVNRIGFLLLLFLPATGWGEETNPEYLRAEIRELRTVIQSLRAENERLYELNDALREEVVRRRQRPRQPDRGSASPDPSPDAQISDPPVLQPELEEPTPATGDEATVLYVNPHWHYLLIESGTEEGLAVGDAGRVLRDGSPIARVEVTHAKPTQAVLDVDPSSLDENGAYPKAGDRVAFP